MSATFHGAVVEPGPCAYLGAYSTVLRIVAVFALMSKWRERICLSAARATKQVQSTAAWQLGARDMKIREDPSGNGQRGGLTSLSSSGVRVVVVAVALDLVSCGDVGRTTLPRRTNTAALPRYGVRST